MTDEDTERAKDQARAQLESIKEMIKRLNHLDDCNTPDECDLTDAEIFAGIEIYYEAGMKASEDDREAYHDKDAARQAIEEDPLSVEVRQDWHSPGSEDDKPTEYNILLCTGGPAVRIVGDLGEHQEPVTANLEYQDWFTAWTRYPLDSDDEATLLTYAGQFYFGE